MANSVNTINTALYRNLTYDFVADFAPIVHAMSSPLLMIVHPSVPAKTLPEFIAYAKANPDKLSMGSGGNGSTGHLAGELFAMMTGVKLIHVPYRGESAARPICSVVSHRSHSSPPALRFRSSAPAQCALWR
jgi:tripartite-type tricarboxylate transporter receptor subunit TctC